MKTHTYSPRQHLFVCTSLLVFLALLLAACGSTSTSGGSATPTPGKMATPQTSCPPAGTARAAIMTPLTLGKQDTLVYSEIRGNPLGPTSVTLKRYNVSTRTATEIVTLQNTNIYESQISADGQWVLLHTMVSKRPAIQLVRMDGQGLQTLYCSPPLPKSSGFGWMQWSPDQKYVAFEEGGPPPGENGTPPADPSKDRFILLNTITGTIQAKARDSNHMLPAPEAWLDSTHLLVVMVGLPGEGGENLSVLDITTWTSTPILDLSTPNQCIDVTFSVDGTQLYISRSASCHGNEFTYASSGPSSIEVRAATGGPAKTIFSAPYGILSLRVATSTSMLFIVNDGVTLTGPNGVWKMNLNGTGLTKLTSAATIIKDPANEEINFAGHFGWNMDQPWANVSRDGAYYSIQAHSRADNGSDKLLIGSMNGGSPVTIASGPVEAPVGWTTM